MTLFTEVCIFVNTKREFTRRDLVFWFGKRLMRGQNTIDCYRNYLTRAGYIKWISRGKYERVKVIPYDLSSRQCRREAYPKYILQK